MAKNTTPHPNTGNTYAAKPEGEKASERLSIRCTPAQLEAIKAKAKAMGVPMSEYVIGATAGW